MTHRPTTSDKLTRRGALAALVGICGVGGYFSWDRRRESMKLRAEHEAAREVEVRWEQLVTIQIGKQVQFVSL